MNKLRHAADRFLATTLVLLMTVMTLNVLWQVFSRYVLRDPSSYTEELARYLLIWVGLLGAAYAAGKKMHLSIDLLPQYLHGRWKQASDVLIQSCVLLFALLGMVAGGLRLVYITLTLNQVSAALQVKLGYVYLALPVSGVFIMFYAVASIVEGLAARPAEAAQARSAHGID